MPLGTPHASFLGPYPIRVDDFSIPRNALFETPALQLLSHTHSDHVAGLSARSFGTRVVCSVDAKHMLLNEEPAATRIAFDNGETTEKTRPYAHLKTDSSPITNRKWGKKYSRDLLRALPLNTPVLIELSDGVEVTVTLIDANHCPGAVMFLVEGSQGNFLHTGDVRAEPAFLASLVRNPSLQRYISPSTSFFDSTLSFGERPLRTLDAIYLDTACLLSSKEIPSKEEACDGVVNLISQFPPFTRFFINSWTWGYEDILKAIGRAFNCQIHVDRYKYIIYSGVSDPFLKSLVTRNSGSTRFHACERWNRCDQVQPGATGVVYVNPVTMSKVQWDVYMKATRKSLEHGGHVTNVLCPLSRHSTLPELRELVNLFRPKLVVPNSLDPELRGLDWACLPRMFGDCMAEGGTEAIVSDMRRSNLDKASSQCLDSNLVNAAAAERVEVEVRNLVGEGSAQVVRLWTGNSQRDPQDRGVISEAALDRARRTLAKLDQFIGLRESQKTNQVIYPAGRGKNNSDDSNCDDAAEARANAAETFFMQNSSLSSAQDLPSMRISQSFVLSSVRGATGSRRRRTQRSDPRRETHFPTPLVSLVSPAQCKILSFKRAIDDLPFGTPSSVLDVPMSHGSKGEYPPHAAMLEAVEPTRLRAALSCMPDPAPAQKRTHVLQLPLASPSITLSPPPLPKSPHSILAPRTPIPNYTTVLQECGVRESMRPPMIDLRKMLKRASTETGMNDPLAKRRRIQTRFVRTSSPRTSRLVRGRQIQPVCTASSTSEEKQDTTQRRNFSVSTGAILPTSSRTIVPHSENVQQIQTASHVTPFSSPMHPAPSATERQRRRKAKEKQAQITVKLLRALPPDKVASSYKKKVEMRKKELAERRMRHKRPTLTIAKQGMSMYNGPPSCSPSSMLSPEKSAVGDGAQGQSPVPDDQFAVDWERTREYEEVIQKQRRDGLQYPPLPVGEGCFAQSQSP